MFSYSLLPLVSFSLCVAVIVATASGNRDSNCYVGRRLYQHNQLFPLPNQSHCIRYICWHGRIIRRVEACEVEGQCHRVGATFEHQCTTYRCNKMDRGQLIYYQPEIISTKCQDFNRRCRRPGEVFPFQMHSRYYDSCTCTTTHTTVRYRCTSYQSTRYNVDNGGLQGGFRSISGGPARVVPYGSGEQDDSQQVSVSISSHSVKK